MRASKCKVENPGSYSLRQPCRPPGSIIQYYSNVALKWCYLALLLTFTLTPAYRINSKLGGVNMILSPGGANTIIDLSSPVIIMGKWIPCSQWSLLLTFASGADVVHPAPGVTGLPSCTALVGNIDDNVAKFVAGECSGWAQWNIRSRWQCLIRNPNPRFSSWNHPRPKANGSR